MTTQKDQPKALFLDIGKYQHHLDHSGLSDEEKEDYLRAMWSLVVAFVDLGYDVLPTETCGEDGLPSPLAGLNEQELLDCSDPELNALFEEAALAADREGDVPHV